MTGNDRIALVLEAQGAMIWRGEDEGDRTIRMTGWQDRGCCLGPMQHNVYLCAVRCCGASCDRYRLPHVCRCDKMNICNMVRNLFLVGLFLFLSGSLRAQSFSDVADSCYYYLERGDTVSFDRTCDGLSDAYERTYNTELYSIALELNGIRARDQGIRLLLLDARKKKRDVSKIRSMMEQTDRRNAGRVAEIIDEYGWLSPDDIGEDANETLFLCIQHAQDSLIQNRYLPILQQAVHEGAAEGWQYAFLADRCLMNRGERQIYGTQRISKDGIDYLVPLLDAERVDSLRAGLGLEPLQEYMSDCGLEQGWSMEYYKSHLQQHESIFDSWYKHMRGSSRED